MKTKKTGFTLIELIVVITIMMVATMVGVASFQSASKKSRDSRRTADLEKIRVALEMYRQDKGYYPDVTISGLSSVLSPTYIQSVPQTGPKGANDQYFYTRNVGTSYTYTMYAAMEDAGSSNATGLPNSCGTNVCNYVVNNP